MCTLLCCRSADVCQPPALAHAHHPIACAADSSGLSDSENERSTLLRPPERAVASRDLESAPLSPPQRLSQRSDRNSGHVHRDGGGEDSQSPPQRMFERIVQPQLRQVASDCGRRLLLHTLEHPSQFIIAGCCTRQCRVVSCGTCACAQPTQLASAIQL